MLLKLKLSIGDAVQFDFCPLSEVIGIDKYTLWPFKGEHTRQWSSYTLKSDAEGAFSRWWIVDLPDMGAHYFTAAEDIPADAEFIPELSGLAALESSGDSSLSSEKSAAAIYKHKSGTLYAQEVFSDDTDRIVFEGRPLPDISR